MPETKKAVSKGTKTASKEPKAASKEGKVVSKGKVGKPHSPRNFKLPGGVWRFSRSTMYAKRGIFRLKNKQTKRKARPKRKPKFVRKPIGGEKNGGFRMVQLKKERKYYPTEDKPRKSKKRKVVCFKDHKRYLRSSITPGTVLIMLAGRHRGKRVVFLKQLRTGLLLVTGPFQLNACPLRRVNQIYVIGTSTKLDISSVNIPEHINDNYFRRKKPQKKSKKDDEEIFETKKVEYTVTEQRKKDQVEVDKQILGVLKAHPEKKYMTQYLKATFSLQNKMYPHKMKF